MFKTPALLQTEPEGSPADDVGIFLIDRLFTNVVQTLSVVMLEPTMNAVVPVDTIVLPLPAKIPLNDAVTVFPLPPPINEQAPPAILRIPPTTDDVVPLITLLQPPPANDAVPLDVLEHPPPANDALPHETLNPPPTTTV